MGLSRRRFLAALLAGTAFDPERLLWVPGAKTISIPAAVIAEPTLDQINAVTVRYLTPALVDLTFTNDPLFYRLNLILV